MAAPLELVLSTDAAGQVANCSVWDPQTGAVLLTYRGGNSTPHALELLGGQYLLGGQMGKNYINVWELQRKASETYLGYCVCVFSLVMGLLINHLSTNHRTSYSRR